MTDDFDSKIKRHALQADEKVDIMFRLLVKWFKHQYPVKFEELKQDWLNER